ncbi:MAG: fibrillarin-like rRNA/tRNA 2'-O-methyltransferase [Candidatus Hermodarchaeota archaeon]
MDKLEIRAHPKFKNVFVSGSSDNYKLYTKNLTPGKRIVDEKLITMDQEEYREWDPYRSKLAALILENPTIELFSDNINCLYLGASSGTTTSYLSDILKDGIVYAVEFAERSIRQLLQNCKERINVIPILGDANFPEQYNQNIFTTIDLIYQDVAQPNQAEIAIKNSEYYLKEGGIIILAIKSQSIDSIIKSEKVYAQEKLYIEQQGYQIIESVNIHKYALNHIILLVQK